MIIGIPRDTLPDETRVAATPETVKRVAASGKHGIVVESGAGSSSASSVERSASSVLCSAFNVEGHIPHGFYARCQTLDEDMRVANSPNRYNELHREGGHPWAS